MLAIVVAKTARCIVPALLFFGDSVVVMRDIALGIVAINQLLALFRAKLEEELNKKRPFKILVVTVLTSFSKHTLPVGMEKKELSDHVLALAQMAYDCGLKNYVCSPLEARLLKTRFDDSYLVTPGIRFEPGNDDQKRTATPRRALDDGANALVIGRPIYKAENPKLAAQEIYNHIRGVN